MRCTGEMFHPGEANNGGRGDATPPKLFHITSLLCMVARIGHSSEISHRLSIVGTAWRVPFPFPFVPLRPTAVPSTWNRLSGRPQGSNTTSKAWPPTRIGKIMEVYNCHLPGEEGASPLHPRQMAIVNFHCFPNPRRWRSVRAAAPTRASPFHDQSAEAIRAETESL